MWWILEDDVLEPIQHMKPEHIPNPTFMRCHGLRYAEPGQPEPSLRDMIQHLLVAQGGASLDYGFGLCGGATSGDKTPRFS